MLDENALHRLADGQDGVFTRRQVIACGGTDDWIKAQLAARRIQRLHRKVYLTTTGRPTRRQRERAALLAVGPWATLSHHTAARRWGLARRGEDDRIHLTVPYGKSADLHTGIEVHRSRAFAHIVVDHTDMPTVSAAHTCIDLAVLEPDARSGMRTFLHAALTMRVGAEELLRALDVRRPRRYRTALRDAARLLQDGVRSQLESWYTIDVERAHGLPDARRQAAVLVGGSERYEDCQYELPGGTLTVRLDGWRYHSDRHAARIDRARDNAAELAGRGRLTFGWEDLGEACTIARTVAEALYARGWTGPTGPVMCACVQVPRHLNART